VAPKPSGEPRRALLHADTVAMYGLGQGQHGVFMEVQAIEMIDGVANVRGAIYDSYIVRVDEPEQEEEEEA